MSLLPAMSGGDSPDLLPPTLVVTGPGGDTTAHAHHGMHVVIARTGSLRATVEGGSEGAMTVEAPGVWIAPDVRHHLCASRCEVAMLFVDPESREGLLLRRQVPAPYRIVDEAGRDTLREFWPRAPGARRDETFASAVFDALGISRAERKAPVHPGVLRALRLLREADRPPTLQELAAAARLSQGRLIHVFTETVGIPPRRYLLWIKVQRASRELSRDATMTEAAHAAGFSDAAHLSRTFRSMFGTTPTELSRNSQFVQARDETSGH